ncbi:aldo/keto reductase [Promicromonospora sp. NPDC057138]|uniref:aldo/keto reductase n=1 Tax=Promicromonospora sp. NPDC057138 TaxID=3346031 RepID=UPI003642E996
MLAGTRERGGRRQTVRAGADPVADDLYGDEDFDVADAVRAVADEKGLPSAQVALAWLLHRPAVTAPIIGATTPHHVDDAVAALDVMLSRSELDRLESPYRPHPVLGHS